MAEQEKMTPATGADETPSEKAKTPKPKKDKVKKGKPGLGKRLGKFFRELKAELKKVSWPTKAETIKKTGVVIVCVVVVGVIVWIFDGIANGVINALLSLFGA